MTCEHCQQRVEDAAKEVAGVTEARVDLAAGTLTVSGGSQAAVMQAVSFVAGFGMTPSQAVHHPRIDVSDAVTVHADQRLFPDVMAALHAQGPTEEVEHGVVPVNFACPNLILNEGGTRNGISDVMSPWSAAVAQG